MAILSPFGFIGRGFFFWKPFVLSDYYFKLARIISFKRNIVVLNYDTIGVG